MWILLWSLVALLAAEREDVGLLQVKSPAGRFEVDPQGDRPWHEGSSWSKHVGSGGDAVAARRCSLETEEGKASEMKEVTLVAPGGGTRCLLEDKGPYEFVARAGDPRKLLLAFEGGGACWDAVSFDTMSACTKDIEYAKQISTLLMNMGPFNNSNTRNPFHDYSMVQVLYCSGDLHVGQTRRIWPVKGKLQLVSQMGYKNARAVLDWVKKNYPSVDSLVIMGSSAGALGAYYWSSTILKEIPHKRSMVLADSYAGVTPPHTTGKLMQGWRSCTLPIWAPHQQELCLQGSISAGDLVIYNLKANPKTSFGAIQSKMDSVQTQFYNLVVITMRVGSLIVADGFLLLANQLLAQYNKVPNFALFRVDGSHHCFDYQDAWTQAGTKGPEEGWVPGPTNLENWVGELVKASDEDGCVSGQCYGNLTSPPAGPQSCDKRLTKEMCS